MSQEILSKVILNKMTLAVGGGGSKLVVGGIRQGGSKGSGQGVSHRVVETKCNALIKN